ncbi:MAG: SCO family protein [Bacteroidia bacterium]
MKKYRPFLVLFAIIILPLLVWVALKLVSEQRYRPIEILSEKIPNPDGSLDSVFRAVGDFAFVTQAGDTLRRSDLQDKIWVATECYGACTETCDLINGYFQQMIEKDFAEDPDIRFVSFSIDPKDDSTSIRAYAEHAKAEVGRWYVVRGNAASMEKFLTEELMFNPLDTTAFKANSLSDRGVRLIDWDGRLRGQLYHGDMEPEMVTLAQHIVLLQKELEELKSGKPSGH